MEQIIIMKAKRKEGKGFHLLGLRQGTRTAANSLVRIRPAQTFWNAASKPGALRVSNRFASHLAMSGRYNRVQPNPVWISLRSMLILAL
ncbi:uncharacterized protein BDV14DRAFT_182701 [Aspergillus stella-maris]|uniref:uncharacterized protein n=1 Tax=Aspergillus stella-maris TaxID=1810926 RepID=UPI003CCCB89F